MTRLPLILAIDPALSCGWAIGFVSPGEHGVLASGCWNLTGDRSAPGVRFVRLRHELRMVSKRHGPIHLLAIERAHPVSELARRSHYGLVAIAEEWAFEETIRVLDVQPNQAKAAAGHGHLDKAGMVIQAERALHRKVGTHDEADAYWILEHARGKWPELSRGATACQTQSLKDSSPS